MSKRKTPRDSERQYWLWVTRPEYYLDEDGQDRRDLDPANRSDPGGWWTCNRDTRRGDLVLLWRTSPKCDIGYLMQAASDAYSLTDEPYARHQGWKYGCDYKVLYKFEHPVTLQHLRGEPHLHDWGAYRANFRGSAFRIPKDHWARLHRLAAKLNRGYAGWLRNVIKRDVDITIQGEEKIEEALVNDLGLLKDFGYDLELYSDPKTGRSGRQWVCKGTGGRIDLLCQDRRKKKRYVVIELKTVKASQRTFGQICGYMGSVQDRIAGRTPVVGLVISRGYDVNFEAAMRTIDRVEQLDLEKLGFQ